MDKDHCIAIRRLAARALAMPRRVECAGVLAFDAVTFVVQVWLAFELRFGGDGK